jgi:hypothetical protein
MFRRDGVLYKVSLCLYMLDGTINRTLEENMHFKELSTLSSPSALKSMNSKRPAGQQPWLFPDDPVLHSCSRYKS